MPHNCTYLTKSSIYLMQRNFYITVVLLVRRYAHINEKPTHREHICTSVEPTLIGGRKETTVRQLYVPHETPVKAAPKSATAFSPFIKSPIEKPFTKHCKIRRPKISYAQKECNLKLKA